MQLRMLTVKRFENSLSFALCDFFSLKIVIGITSLLTSVRRCFIMAMWKPTVRFQVLRVLLDSWRLKRRSPMYPAGAELGRHCSQLLRRHPKEGDTDDESFFFSRKSRQYCKPCALHTLRILEIKKEPSVAADDSFCCKVTHNTNYSFVATVLVSTILFYHTFSIASTKFV